MKTHCLQAIRIVDHHANSRIVWLISGHQSVNPSREAISILSDKKIYVCLSCDHQLYYHYMTKKLQDTEDVKRRFLRHLENTPEIKFECQEDKQSSNILELYCKIF